MYIERKPKCTRRWKQSSVIKQLLEAMFLAIKMCTGFITDVIWMKIMCVVCQWMKTMCVNGESYQSSSRRALSFKDSSALLNIWEMKKSKVFLIASTMLVVKAENIYMIAFRYIFSVFTVSSVLPVRTTSLLWISFLRYR